MLELQSYYQTDLKSVYEISLDDRSKYLRSLIMRAILNGGRGHVGSALSMVETIRVLYDDILNIHPDEPLWEGRDRYILSKGHGCLALYAQLAASGFFDICEMDNFCRFDSMLSGHPEIVTPGVEASTGALGHGMPIGFGKAIALRNKNIDAQVYVHVGDGEINEGSVWEAAAAASKYKLGNYNIIIDYNKLQSAGPVMEIQPMEPLADKWKSFGFKVMECNGHDVASLKKTLSAITKWRESPSVLIAHTLKGKGIPSAENNPKWHHKSSLTEEEVIQIRDALDVKSNA